MFSAPGNSVLKFAMPSAVIVSRSLLLATSSCSVIFCLINSRVIRSAAPDT